MEWLISAAQWFGSAVCHQLPANSYQFAGVVLPLCARCTGMYLGALFTLGFHAWRHPRGRGLPRPWIIIVLVLFFFAWAGDGTNSFLSAIPIAPHLYEPSNLLRLVTGALMGVSIGSLFFVVFNSIVLRAPKAETIFVNDWEFFLLLGIMAIFVFLVQSEMDLILYPLVATSLVAILALHGSMMTALVANLNQPVQYWREALPEIAIGLLVALSYLSAFALIRSALT